MLANLAPILGGPVRSEYGARVVPAGEVKVFTGEPVTVSGAVLRRHHCGRLARISCGGIRCALKTSGPPARIGSSRVLVKQGDPCKAIHPGRSIRCRRLTRRTNGQLQGPALWLGTSNSHKSAGPIRGATDGARCI
jgi:hypothetical protein